MSDTVPCWQYIRSCKSILILQLCSSPPSSHRLPRVCPSTQVEILRHETTFTSFIILQVVYIHDDLYYYCPSPCYRDLQCCYGCPVCIPSGSFSSLTDEFGLEFLLRVGTSNNSDVETLYRQIPELRSRLSGNTPAAYISTSMNETQLARKPEMSVPSTFLIWWNGSTTSTSTSTTTFVPTTAPQLPH